MQLNIMQDTTITKPAKRGSNVVNLLKFAHLAHPNSPYFTGAELFDMWDKAMEYYFGQIPDFEKTKHDILVKHGINPVDWAEIVQEQTGRLVMIGVTPNQWEANLAIRAFCNQYPHISAAPILLNYHYSLLNNAVKAGKVYRALKNGKWAYSLYKDAQGRLCQLTPEALGI